MSTIKIDPQALGLRPDVSAEEIAEVLRQRFSRNGTGKMSQAEALVNLVVNSGALLFHDDIGNAYAQVPVGGHQETLRCRGKEFRRWLSWRFHKETWGKVPNSDALNSALNSMEGKARYEGPEHPLLNRVAWHGGAIWYDLADPDWRAGKVTSGGWTVEQSTPVPLFRRYAHQQAQPVPVPGGSPLQLLRFLNLSNKATGLLLVVYATTCLIPDIPHPILIFHGVPGSAKTTASRLLRRLLDPSATETLSLPGREAELVQKLSHNWLAPFDNLGDLSDWVQDCFCRAATGQGFSKRELYSDDDDVIYAFRRCLVLNGVNIAATNSDMLRRALLFPLEQIRDETRRTERELLAAFDEARPAIFGGLLDALTHAMRLYPDIKLAGYPEMPDFCHWGAAIAQALGSTPEAFLQAYSENIREQHREAIEGSLVATLVMALIEGKESWEGTPAELYSAVKTKAEEMKVNTSGRAFPQAANWLSRTLNKVKANLKVQGVHITQGTGGVRRYTLQRVGENTAHTTRPPDPDINGGAAKLGGINGSIRMDTALSDPPAAQIEQGSKGGKNGISSHLLGQTPSPAPTPKGDIPLTCLQHGLTPHRLVPDQGRVCNHCQPPPPLGGVGA